MASVELKNRSIVPQLVLRALKRRCRFELLLLSKKVFIIVVTDAGQRGHVHPRVWPRGALPSCSVLQVGGLLLVGVQCTLCSCWAVELLMWSSFILCFVTWIVSMVFLHMLNQRCARCVEPETGRPIPGTSTRHAAPQVFTNDVVHRTENVERITIWSWKRWKQWQSRR